MTVYIYQYAVNGDTGCKLHIQPSDDFGHTCGSGFIAHQKRYAIFDVIHLEDWDKDREYDRLGMEEEYIEYLGNKVVCHNIPIRPGRNLAIICESAAVNHRQKKMGYNAAQELYQRVQKSLAQKREEE